MSDPRKTKCYLVQSEGESRVVEAPSFGDAIYAWRAAHLEIYGDDPASGWTNETEPDSVSLLSDEPCIR